MAICIIALCLFIPVAFLHAVYIAIEKRNISFYVVTSDKGDMPGSLLDWRIALPGRSIISLPAGTRIGMRIVTGKRGEASEICSACESALFLQGYRIRVFEIKRFSHSEDHDCEAIDDWMIARRYKNES